jgi:hypothetical protein
MAESANGTLNSEGKNSSNKGLHQMERLLALEVRPQKFGFVVFEGPTRLLDWGVKSYQVRGISRRAILRKRISFLLRMYVPSVLAVRQGDSSPRKARRAILWATEIIRAQASGKSTGLYSLKTREIWSFFAAHGCTNKHHMATLLAKWFEELSWRLQPARKPWQGEKSNTLVFDAAATGIAFFNRRGRRGRGIGSS